MAKHACVVAAADPEDLSTWPTCLRDARNLHSSDRQRSPPISCRAIESTDPDRQPFGVAGERWADPRAKLLSGEEWEAARPPRVLRTLELPANPGSM